ncbi:MAG TPA: class I lanthipeptide [Puia sp.]|nr:class I lanthipeptide [Puia sp.]
MKKVDLKKKRLTLGKKIVSNLENNQAARVVGGDAFTSLISCHTYHSGSACSGCQTCCPTPP